MRWNAVCIAFDVNIVDVSCSESPDFRILLYTEGSIALRLWRRVLRPDEKGRREVHLMWKVRRGERGKRLTKGLQRCSAHQCECGYSNIELQGHVYVI